MQYTSFTLLHGWLCLFGVWLELGPSVYPVTSQLETRRPVGASSKDHKASGEQARNGLVDISGGVIAIPTAAH